MTLVVTQKKPYQNRPKYENPETLRDEKIFQDYFQAKFPDHSLRKNPIQYRMDWSVLKKKSEEVIAMIEYRSRRYTKKKIEDWGGIKLSLAKFQAAIILDDKMGIPCRMFFRFSDCEEGQYYRFDLNKESYEQCNLSWMNMIKRNDPQDQEPVVLVPMDLLVSKQL